MCLQLKLEHYWSVSEKNTDSKKSKVIEKVKPEIEENNIIKLEPQKEKEHDELEIFDEQISESNSEEKPLILTQEIKDDKISIKSENNQTLSPAVRKIVLKIKLILNQ